MESHLQAPVKRTDLSAFLWLTQVISGGLLAFVLILHLIAHHFIVEGGLRSFQQVLAYIAVPSVFTIEVVFLFTVTLHAVLGVRAVLLDLNPGKRWLWVVNIGMTILGSAALIYGVWLAIALQSLAI